MSDALLLHTIPNRLKLEKSWAGCKRGSSYVGCHSFVRKMGHDVWLPEFLGYY